MNETDITNVRIPSKIEGSKGIRDDGCMTSGKRIKYLTLMSANSTIGSYVVPMFSFPKQRMAEGQMAIALSGSYELCTHTLARLMVPC